MKDTFAFLRQEVLETLIKRIVDFKEGYRQNIAILGDEHTGKTTLLKAFASNLTDERLICVYIDVAPFEFSLFLKRFLNSLFYHYLKSAQLLSSRENLDVLIKRAKEPLPQSATLAEQLLAKLDKEKPEILFKDLFAVLESFNLETGQKCVVIFDEFQNIKKLGVKNICQELGKKIMFQKNALFIFSSSLKNEARNILADELSLLFGNFQTIELQMPSVAACETLMKNVFGDIGLPRESTAFLVNFTGGHPFYLRAVCEEASRLCRLKAKDSLDEETLTNALENLLFSDWGLLNLKFMSFCASWTSERHKNDFIRLLEAIATGKNRLKDLAAHMGCQRKEISLKLARLSDAGILSKNGSFFCINDRLMAFWLKFVRYEKNSSLSPDFAEQAHHFRENIRAQIAIFVDASKKNVEDRMLELFNEFEKDDIQVDKKRIRLAPFRELKIIAFDELGLKVGLFGKTQDSLWLAVIKEEGISEHDVQEFLQTAKKFKHKIVNKLMIGLGDIDRNARLLAKESKILTWDLMNINNLFDIYGKPRIVK